MSHPLSDRYDHTFFDAVDNEAKAYALGLLYADGYVSKHSNEVSIELKQMDGGILSTLSRLICKGVDYTKHSSTGGNPMYSRRLSIYSKPIKAALIVLGCVPQKTFKVRLPALAPNMMRHFVRGYFDGDGCFTIAHGRRPSSPVRPTFKIVSSTAFCKDLATHLLEREGMYLGVYHPCSNPDVGALQCGNDNTIRSLYHYLYDGATICLARKRDKLKRYLDLLDTRPSKWSVYTFAKNGVRYDVKNLNVFASVHGLSQGNVRKLVRGHMNQCNGFTFERIQEGTMPSLLRQ